MSLDQAQFFQLLSDETRLRSLMLMQQEGELCVCELVYALDIIQPKVSRHLATLRDAAIVVDRRQGQWIYYQINPELEQWVISILATTTKANCDKSPFSDDLKTLRAMPNRPDSACCR